MWSEVFEIVEQTLGARLTHLDENDPLRRKPSSLHDAGKFVCDYRPKETSRWIFGRFQDRRLEFAIMMHRGDSRWWYNTLRLYGPADSRKTPIDWNAVRQVFATMCVRLQAFYAWADVQPTHVVHPDKVYNMLPLGLESELDGIYWLTYLNSAYVEFFGQGRVNSMPYTKPLPGGGALLELADNPLQVPDDTRENVMIALGRQSFYDNHDYSYKPPGQFALTRDQLERYSELHPG